MVVHQLAKCGSRVVGCNLPILQPTSYSMIQLRKVHESYIPQGRGGRSSFSGVVATVFGGTGFVGRTFLNRLARIGSNIMVPYRGSYETISRLKVMADLGQMMFREFSIKDDDDKVRELIQYSNTVVNLIGSNIPYNSYSRKEVNLDWPRRLASLVAEKGDGTRLLHVTHLNCTQPEGRQVSKLLDFDHRAETAMREIYPDTIIVRCSNIFGYQDTYTRFFIHDRFEKDLAKFGALPLLYDNGKSTLTQPIYVGDVGEALTRIVKHLDAPGQTFELFGPGRYLLKDFVKYLYRIVEKDCYLYDSLGPMDSSRANLVQKGIQKALDMYFSNQTSPRLFIPRFLDMLNRRFTSYHQWTSKDYFNQIHVNDFPTGVPGLEQLGIVPTHFEDKVYFMHGWIHRHEGYKIPSEENFPPMKQYPSNAPRIGSSIVPEIEG